MACAVVVVSKTFTTAETMLNARTLREWISSALGYVLLNDHPEVIFVREKFCASSIEVCLIKLKIEMCLMHVLVRHELHIIRLAPNIGFKSAGRWSRLYPAAKIRQ